MGIKRFAGFTAGFLLSASLAFAQSAPTSVVDYGGGAPGTGGAGSCTGDFCAASAPLVVSLGGTGIDNSAATGVQFYTAGTPSVLGTTGTGNLCRVTNCVLVTPTLGTIVSGNLAAGTGYTLANLAGLGTGCGTFLATPTSANLRGCITDESGTGVAIFGTAPTISSLTVTTALTATGLVTIADLAATGTPSSSTVLYGDGTWKAVGAGTVTSITGGTGILPSTNPCIATCVLNTTLTNNAQTGTTYATVAGDGGKIVSLSNASPVAVSLSQANQTGFTAGFAVDYHSIGAGTTTVTAAGGSVFDDGQAALAIVKGQDLFTWSDSTNYHSILSLPTLANNAILANVAGAGRYPIGATGSNITALLAGNLGAINAANIWASLQTFAAVNGGENVQSGTTYTLVASDCGKTVSFSNGSAVTVTIPASIVPATGTFCDIKIRQDGAGAVSVNGSAVTPATLVTAHSYTKTAAQHAIIGLELTTISATATAVLTGDGA